MEQNLALYFQFMTPARKLTHNMKFEHFWMQKDMNFGNAMIIHHFEPEKCQKSYPERHEFWECHDSLSLWAREMPKIRPRKTQISGIPQFFVTLGQKIAKIQPRKTRISGNCTH